MHPQCLTYAHATPNDRASRAPAFKPPVQTAQNEPAFKDFDVDDETFSPFAVPARTREAAPVVLKNPTSGSEVLSPSGSQPGGTVARIPSYRDESRLQPEGRPIEHGNHPLQAAQTPAEEMVPCNVEYITAWSTYVTIDTEAERGQPVDASRPLVLARPYYSGASDGAATPAPSASSDASTDARAVQRYVSLRNAMRDDACGRTARERQAVRDYLHWVLDDVLPKCEPCRHNALHPR